MEHVRTFGQRGSEPGQLLFPSGIAVNETGAQQEVFVAELGNHRISVFSKKGNYDRSFGSMGTAPGQLFEPRGLCFAKGWLLVAEAKRVSVLSPTGEARLVADAGPSSKWAAASWPRRMPLLGGIAGDDEPRGSPGIEREVDSER